MMTVGFNQVNGLLTTEVVGIPNDNQQWIRGEEGVSAWRITERSVTLEHNRINITQADGTDWLVKVKGEVRSGKVVKGYVDITQLDRFGFPSQDSVKQTYKYGETVVPLGVKADFLIGIGVLSLAELETLIRPMSQLSKMGGQGSGDDGTEDCYGDSVTDEQSALIARNEQKIEELKSKLSSLKNEIARSQELLSELDGDIGVKLLADSDKYSLASYPDVPHYPLYETDDVRKYFKGKAGIYFAISRKHGGIEYVGRSEDLGTRVSAGRDELRGCIFSILQMPEWETHAAELAYIAACRPARNAHIQRAHNGRVNSGTPKEYLTVSQARDYVARTTWGAKTLHDATIDGLKIKAISDGRELVSVADLKRIVESEWCFEEIEAAHRAAEQGKKLKRGIKF